MHALFLSAFLVDPNEVRVGVGDVAVRTDEGPIQLDVVMVSADPLTAVVLRGPLPTLILDAVQVFGGPWVQTHPGRAQLSERAEEATTELIDVMAEHVGALNEL
jgi:hypothetical protein